MIICFTVYFPARIAIMTRLDDADNLCAKLRKLMDRVKILCRLRDNSNTDRQAIKTHIECIQQNTKFKISFSLKKILTKPLMNVFILADNK